VWLAVGRKAASSLRFRRYEITAEWAGFADKPTYHDAQAVGHRLAELYETEEVDRVVLIYNRFESMLTQRVTTTDLLPIREEVLAGEEPAEDEREGVRGDFIYEPEPEEILQRLLPVYLETEIYRALLESAAAFLASQMTAMRNASKNADDLVDNLTLSLNRARQAEITQEILEVVAGADALTG
jgi:F-type H+-transporting ATPase subunit gamma